MQFELSEEHEAFRKVVRDFAEQEIAPRAATWDHDAPFATDLVHKMGDLGLFALPFPEDVGGMGGDFTSLCVAIEEIGRVDQSMGITLEAGVGLGINPLYNYGTAEQKADYLPDLLSGRALAGFGLTEAEAGSDAGATRTKAEIDGDEWVINGDHVAGHHHRQDRAEPDFLDHQARRDARLCRGARISEDGMARLGHPRAHL